MVTRGLLIFTSLALVACGGHGGGPDASTVSPLQAELVGTWTVDSVKCDSNNITSNYIPSGGSIVYQFDGAKLTQVKSYGGCTQAVSMPYTFDGTTLLVPNGSPMSVLCAPSGCTRTGLLPSSACGMIMPSSSDVLNSVTFSGTPVSQMQTSESDAQGASICSQYSASTPFKMSMTKN